MFWWSWKLSLQLTVMVFGAATDSWGWFAFGVFGGLVEHVNIHFDIELGLR